MISVANVFEEEESETSFHYVVKLLRWLETLAHSADADDNRLTREHQLRDAASPPVASAVFLWKHNLKEKNLLQH